MVERGIKMDSIKGIEKELEEHKRQLIVLTDDLKNTKLILKFVTNELREMKEKGEKNEKKISC